MIKTATTNHKTRRGTVNNKEAHTYTHLRSRTLLSMHTGIQVKQETRAMQPLYQSARGKHRQTQTERISPVCPFTASFHSQNSHCRCDSGPFHPPAHTLSFSISLRVGQIHKRGSNGSSSVRELNSQKSFGIL